MRISAGERRSSTPVSYTHLDVYKRQVSPKHSVLHALKIMAEYDVGALVVLDGQRLAGMFSERDYARKVILQGKVSVYTKVSEVMTDKVVSVTMEDVYKRQPSEAVFAAGLKNRNRPVRG